MYFSYKVQFTYLGQTQPLAEFNQRNWVKVPFGGVTSMNGFLLLITSSSILASLLGNIGLIPITGVTANSRLETRTGS